MLRTLQRMGSALVVLVALFLVVLLPVRAAQLTSAGLPAFSFPFSQ